MPKLDINASTIGAYRPLGNPFQDMLKQRAAEQSQMMEAQKFMLQKQAADRQQATVDKMYELSTRKQDFLEGTDGRELAKQAEQAKQMAEARALLEGKVADKVTNTVTETKSTFTPEVKKALNTKYKDLMKTGNFDAAQKFKEKYGYEVSEPIYKQMPGYVPGVTQIGAAIGEGAHQLDKGLTSLRNYLGYDEEKDVANDPIKYAGSNWGKTNTYAGYRDVEEARKAALEKQKSYDDSLEALNREAILSSQGTKDFTKKVTKGILRDKTDEEKLALIAESAKNIDTSTVEGKNKAIAFNKVYEDILKSRDTKELYAAKQAVQQATEDKRFQRDVDLAVIKERIKVNKSGKPSAKDIAEAKGKIKELDSQWLWLSNEQKGELEKAKAILKASE